MIGAGRLADYEYLTEVVNDISKPTWQRQRAYRVMTSLKLKARNRSAMLQRFRIVNANTHTDVCELENLSERVKRLEKRDRIVRKYR